jgi:hypothetical protein
MKKSFSVKFEGIEYEGEVEIEMSHDANYGADADGNRGISQWFVDELEVLNCYDESGMEIEVDEIPGLEKAVEDFIMDNIDDVMEDDTREVEGYDE